MTRFDTQGVSEGALKVFEHVDPEGDDELD
jgi:hypothetical protein